jgi:hypothetical protein
MKMDGVMSGKTKIKMLMLIEEKLDEICAKLYLEIPETFCIGYQLFQHLL